MDKPGSHHGPAAQNAGPARVAGLASPPPVLAWTIIAVAVLGALVVGLIISVPSPPATTGCGLECGLLFSWGTPVNDTGSTGIGCPSVPGHYCYTIEVAGSAIQLTNLTFSLRGENGSRAPWPYPVLDSVSLVDPRGAIVSVYDTADSAWAGPVNSTSVAGGDTLVIYTPHAGAQYGLFGVSIVAVIRSSSGTPASIPSEGFS